MDILELTNDIDPAQIHVAALEILEQVGLEMPCHETRSRLVGANGITIRDNRVYIQADPVDDVVGKMRPNDLYHTKWSKEWRFAGGGHCHWWLDIDGEFNPFTTENLPQAIAFTQACEKEGLSAGCPGWPTNEHPSLQPLTQNRIAAEYLGRLGGAAIQDLAVLEYWMEMLGVFDRKLMLGPHVLSPLKLAGNEWDYTIYLLDRLDNPSVHDTIFVGNMPAMGATAPCDYQAAWAQSMAETLGGAVVMKALGAPNVIAEGTLYPFDMRRGIWIYGSAEHALITLQEKKLRDYYGLPPRGAKSLESSVPCVDLQAASEKTFHTTLAALAGYTSFGGAGCLGIDDIWSPVQLMIDIDIVNSVRHIVAGAREAHPRKDIVKAVQDGLVSDGYFAAELTLQQHRDIYWTPGVFPRETLGQWKAEGRPDTTKNARAKAEKLLAGSVPQSVLDRNKAKALDDILSSARRTLLRS